MRLVLDAQRTHIPYAPHNMIFRPNLLVASGRSLTLKGLIDFESRASAADELIEPKLDEGIKVRAAKKIAKELSEPA